MTTRTRILLASSLVIASGAAFVACGNDVRITAETTGSSHATGSSGTMIGSTTSSSGGTTMGGTGGSGGASTTSSSSAGGPPPSGKLVTAETDMAQYQSFTVSTTDTEQSTKVLDGPFFVTDVAGAWGQGQGGPRFFLVSNGDCTGYGIAVLSTVNTQGGPPQLHGIRMPVLPGQTLCMTGTNMTGIVMGFRPY